MTELFYRCNLRIISWQGIADALQTAALTRGEDYRLKNLVESFSLAGDLITA